MSGQLKTINVMQINFDPYNCLRMKQTIIIISFLMSKKRYYVYSSLDKSPLTISPNIFAQFALDVTVVLWTLVRCDRSPLIYNKQP